MINYPKGTHRQEKVSNALTRSKKTQRVSLYSRRGMGLEDEINQANDYYLENHLAVIHKKPTPVTIVGVDYPMRSAAKITEAYFQKPSTTDYNGVYQGRYIDFDAKETSNKTSFPLKNLHEHQIRHLANVLSQGGIGFIIIKFTKFNESYIYPASRLIAQWQDRSQARSITYAAIVEHSYQIPTSLNPSLDYLRALDSMLSDLT
ncbi:Holliday junction resolvase RecU [Convivina intestini]|uniref:Holliday junction resolvase RecU n=1 Tax=Convivina intestini TaxID=1505726 RepID=A0A2U1DC30_9LACO|nr:Holliday junction resolvase RecU [Convivina intestini]PVY85220.1 recombination protein U [Convivina intestini]CAH1852478.1 Holliday junction resolvase RecU [Convivina intestini]CAH1854601.1 Holliday junction resolvase RecU [Convivina intestini]SDC01171.1 recombination protein U [Leuconostocaceae bacterium R-53105]